jgi:hypothetical protein
MDEGEALLFAEARRLGAGLVVVGAVQHDFGAEAAGGCDFDKRSGERHDDDGANAAAGGVVGDALGVVAGAGCDDAALCLVGGQGCDFVERSAFFEAAGHLQVFKLEEDALRGHAREHLGAHAGRAVDRTSHPLTGCKDFRQGQGGGCGTHGVYRKASGVGGLPGCLRREELCCLQRKTVSA